MDLDQALQTFLAESHELLTDMENALLGLEQAEEKSDAVNAIFRAAHTIKGSSGLFGLDHVVAFTHVVENVLDQVRAGSLSIGPALIELLLACCDHIGALVNAIEGGQTAPDPELQARGEPLLERLRGHLAQRDEGGGRQVAASGVQEGDQTQRIGGARLETDHWHISLRFGSGVLRNGMDPLSFIRYLGTLGRIIGIVTIGNAIPPADEMDPELCYLGYEIALESAVDKATIESAFEFVRDDCRLRILPPNSAVAEYLRLIQDAPNDEMRLGEMLLRCGSLTRQELDAALRVQQESNDKPPIGEVLVEQRAVRPEVVEAALTKQKQTKELHAQESRSVRVDAEKLDELINLVGELIIAAASASLVARATRIAELQEANSKLSLLVEEVRDSALQLRMVKIGATFTRFQRVVHDVSRELGKDIALRISGEDTELDKTVVEKIGDPLMHLVRNSMDHGIESAELRAERGKPAQGTVRLNAYHDSGSIVIEVGDDGGGLKRERILAKAVERGLVEAGRNLTDAEINALIFEPGFSTAEQVTNLSGRGVGLDVVKRNITALRGTVDVWSEEGQGTTVTVRLPLTLAIINGFQVGIGKSVFVVPLEMVEECVEYSAEEGHDYTNLRGEVLPFVRLRELFDVEGAASRRQNIVIVKHAGQRAGLVVDTLLGEFQTVIKPLGRIFNHVRCISGSSILGNGDVALILDVPALVQRFASDDRQGHPPAAGRRQLEAA